VTIVDVDLDVNLDMNATVNLNAERSRPSPANLMDNLLAWTIACRALVVVQVDVQGGVHSQANVDVCARRT